MYHPDIDGQVEAIRDGDFYAMAEKMGNVLETVTIPAYPVIEEIKDCMKHCGAVKVVDVRQWSRPRVWIFRRPGLAGVCALKKRKHRAGNISDKVFP